jgi:hypothetical protein
MASIKFVERRIIYVIICKEYLEWSILRGLLSTAFIASSFISFFCSNNSTNRSFFILVSRLEFILKVMHNKLFMLQAITPLKGEMNYLSA